MKRALSPDVKSGSRPLAERRDSDTENMAWVYILQNPTNGRFYIGSTTDIGKRIAHHRGGFTPSTKRLGAINLVLKQEYPDLPTARIIERKLKKLKRRDYIEKIVREGIITMRV